VLKRAGHFLKNRFFPDKVAEDAGVKFLNKAGFLRERFDRIETFTEESMINKESGYTITTLPWLNIRKDTDNFERNDYMNDLLEYYQELCAWIKSEKLLELEARNQVIREKRLTLREEGVAEKKLPKILEATEEVLKDLPIDPELITHRSRIERFLRWGGDTLLGISFENPDDNKSIVMRTPVIMDQGRVKTVYKGGGEGETDPSKIPE
jgi:hypothetical protein